MADKLAKDLKSACLRQCGFRIVNGRLQQSPEVPDGLKIDQKRGINRWLNNYHGENGKMTTFRCSFDASLTEDGPRTYRFDVVITEPSSYMYDQFVEKLNKSFSICVIGHENYILAAGTDSEIATGISEFY